MNAVLQSDKSLDSTLDFGRPGFVMSPFEGESGTVPLVYLRPDAQYSCRYKPLKFSIPLVDPLPDPVGREIHINLVGEAIKAIQTDTLRKVVVSRRFSVPWASELLTTAYGMMQGYPNAFTYLFHHHAVGTWMGATPEVLLKYADGLGETVALAGTRSEDPSTPGNEWTSKERYEQGVVTDFIIEQIRAMKLKSRIGTLRNVRAGKLWHLGTTLQTALPMARAGELLRELHPTPAVCGLPRDKAHTFIRDFENYDREYYTGFLGEIGLEVPGSFSTYVNLRCAQIRNGRAYIYVGGGITADSEAVLEWEEIQQKSTTVLSLLDYSWNAIG